MKMGLGVENSAEPRPVFAFGRKNYKKA